MSKQDPSKQQRTRRTWITVSAVVIAAALFVSLVILQPAVPDRVTLLTGPEGGAYYALGLLYAEDLGERGLEVDVEATAGIHEILPTLAEGGNVVAFVPSVFDATVAPDVDTSHLVSLGSVRFEPLWLFSRSDLNVEKIPDLQGRTILTGARGTVSDVVARRLIEKNELGDVVALQPVSDVRTNALVEGLGDDTIDAVFVVGSPGSPIVRALLLTDGVSFLSFERARAYAGLMPGLTALEAPQGVFDLPRNIPPEDVDMLSAVTCLAAHEDLHSAVVPMFLIAAENVNEETTRFSIFDPFPNGDHIPFRLDIAAKRYYSDGETGLAKFFPYKVTRYLNHLGFMVLPLLVIVLLLLKIVPMGLSLYTGILLKGWFAKLAAIEKARVAGEEREKLLADLDRIDKSSAGMLVTHISAQDYVDFRQFLSDLRDRVER